MVLLIPVSAYDVRRNVGVRGVALVGVLSTVHASCRALKLLSCVCTCVAHGGGGGGGGEGGREVARLIYLASVLGTAARATYLRGVGLICFANRRMSTHDSLWDRSIKYEITIPGTPFEAGSPDLLFWVDSNLVLYELARFPKLMHARRTGILVTSDETRRRQRVLNPTTSLTRGLKTN